MELHLAQLLGLLAMPLAAAAMARALVAMVAASARRKEGHQHLKIDITISGAADKTVLHREVEYPMSEESRQGVLREVRQQLMV